LVVPTSSPAMTARPFALPMRLLSGQRV
jgi:hypothetical protein